MTAWITFALITVALIIVWFVFSPTNSASSPEPSPTPLSPVNVLSPPPAPIPVSDLDVLFEDNFEQSGGWDLSPVGQAEYRNGAIYLEDSNITDYGWSRPHLRIQDFILETDSYWLGGAVGGVYGIRFRMLDTGEFLALHLKNDGWFTIIKSDESGQVTLMDSFSPAINRSGGVNRIHIEAKDDHFRFFVNGGYLVDVQIPAPDAGDIMFLAQKAEGTDTFSVAFDNLIIALAP
jgi:hypothetical protein